MSEGTLQNLKVGDRMPPFDLKSVTGGNVKSDDLLGNLSVIAFICNHCPYVVGSIYQINQLLQSYMNPSGSGTKPIKAIFVSANDPMQYPEDGPEKMTEYHAQNELCAPYLFDETQQVAKAFGAQCTPEFFVFDEAGLLVYQGAFNDSPRDPTKVTRVYLDEALLALVNNKPIKESFVRPIGCSIKWKHS